MDSNKEPPAKKTKNSYENCGIFCETSLTMSKPDDPVVGNPTKQGLKTIFHAAELCQDDVFDRFPPIWDDILKEDIKIWLHKKCRTIHATKRNIVYAQRSTTVSGDQTERPSCLSRLRRLDTSKFNVRSDCFICGKSYKWKEKLAPISTGKGESTRKRVLDAAIKINDDEIQMCMLAYLDLFALDAKYHHSCYSHFNNIKAAKGKKNCCAGKT